MSGLAFFSTRRLLLFFPKIQIIYVKHRLFVYAEHLLAAWKRFTSKLPHNIKTCTPHVFAAIGSWL